MQDLEVAGQMISFVFVCFAIPFLFFGILFFIVWCSRGRYIRTKEQNEEQIEPCCNVGGICTILENDANCNCCCSCLQGLSDIHNFIHNHTCGKFYKQNNNSSGKHEIFLKQSYRVLSALLLAILVVVILVADSSSKIINLTLSTNFTSKTLYDGANILYPYAFALIAFQGWFAAYLVLKKMYLKFFEGQEPENGNADHNEIPPIPNPNALKKVWIALSGGGIRASSIAVGALKRINELESKVIARGEHIGKQQIAVKGICTVSGGGYAGSSYLLWKKEIKEFNKVLENVTAACVKIISAHGEPDAIENWTSIKEDLKKSLDIIVNILDEKNERNKRKFKYLDNEIRKRWNDKFVRPLRELFGFVEGAIANPNNANEIVVYVTRIERNIINELLMFASDRTNTPPWFKHYEEKMKENPGFLIHWNAGIANPVLNMLFSIWTFFLDTIWALVFLLILPFVFSLMAISPVLIVLSDLFEQILYLAANSSLIDHSLPFLSRYCLNEIFLEMNDNSSVSWDVWVKDVRTCQFGSTLNLNSSKCSLIEFSDPIPSVFFFTIVGCLVVYFFAFLHLCRHGFCKNSPCFKELNAQDQQNQSYIDCSIIFNEHSKKGGVFHTTIVLGLSILGYCIAINAENYKCEETESLNRIFLFTITLLSVWIPLFSPERYGGVLFLFSCSSLILAVRIQIETIVLPIANSTIYDEGARTENWNYALILAGLFAGISPFLNYARFHVFSHYYRHRISMTYYPKGDGDVHMKNIKTELEKFANWIFRCGGLRDCNANITCEEVWNSFGKSSGKSFGKLVNIAFAFFRFPFNLNGGWFYINETKIQDLVDTDQEYISQISVHNVSNDYDNPKYYMNDSTISKDILIASSKKRYEVLRSDQINDLQDDKDPLVATVTAISGGAFSPNFGDQMPNAPTSLIAFLGGFCGRWIRIKVKDQMNKWFILLGSFCLVALASCLISFGSVMLQVCSQGPSYDQNQCKEARTATKALEFIMVGATILFMIFLIVCPSFVQTYGLLSNPLVMSLASLLSVPSTWENLTVLFASDGGHYENLGIIPLLVHEGLEKGDVVLSIDSSGESCHQRKEIFMKKRREHDDFRLGDKVVCSEFEEEPLIAIYQGNAVEEPPRMYLGEKEKSCMEKFISGCLSYCESNDSKVVIATTKEKQIDEARTLFEALKYVQNYDKKQFHFSFKANPQDLRNYLGEDYFENLTQEELRLLKCENYSQTKPSYKLRTRYLKIEVTRKENPRFLEQRGLNNEEPIKTFQLYHVRPRTYEEDGANEIYPSLVKNNFWKKESLMLFAQMLISVGIILFVVISFFVGLIHLMEWFTFGESISGQLNITSKEPVTDVFYKDSRALWKYQLAGFYGIILTMAMIVIGQRKFAFLPSLIILLALLPVNIVEFWFILVGIVTFLGLVAFCCFQSALFGNFPNHNTVTMQPFGNSDIFESYSKQGYLGVKAVFEEVLEPSLQNPLQDQRDNEAEVSASKESTQLGVSMAGLPTSPSSHVNDGEGAMPPRSHNDNSMQVHEKSERAQDSISVVTQLKSDHAEPLESTSTQTSPGTSNQSKSRDLIISTTATGDISPNNQSSKTVQKPIPSKDQAERKMLAAIISSKVVELVPTKMENSKLSTNEVITAASNQSKMQGSVKTQASVSVSAQTRLPIPPAPSSQTPKYSPKPSTQQKGPKLADRYEDNSTNISASTQASSTVSNQLKPRESTAPTLNSAHTKSSMIQSNQASSTKSKQPELRKESETSSVLKPGPSSNTSTSLIAQTTASTSNQKKN